MEIKVSIVYAEKDQQWFKEYTVKRGTSAGELIQQSGFMSKIELLRENSIHDLRIGIFSNGLNLTTCLNRETGWKFIGR